MILVQDFGDAAPVPYLLSSNDPIPSQPDDWTLSVIQEPLLAPVVTFQDTPAIARTSAGWCVAYAEQDRFYNDPRVRAVLSFSAADQPAGPADWMHHYPGLSAWNGGALAVSREGHPILAGGTFGSPRVLMMAQRSEPQDPADWQPVTVRDWGVNRDAHVAFWGSRLVVVDAGWPSEGNQVDGELWVSRAVVRTPATADDWQHLKVDLPLVGSPVASAVTAAGDLIIVGGVPTGTPGVRELHMVRLPGPW